MKFSIHGEYKYYNRRRDHKVEARERWDILYVGDKGSVSEWPNGLA